MDITRINKAWVYLIQNAAAGSIIIVGAVIVLDHVVGGIC